MVGVVVPPRRPRASARDSTRVSISRVTRFVSNVSSMNFNASGSLLFFACVTTFRKSFANASVASVFLTLPSTDVTVATTKFAQHPPSTVCFSSSVKVDLTPATGTASKSIVGIVGGCAVSKGLFLGVDFFVGEDFASPASASVSTANTKSARLASSSRSSSPISSTNVVVLITGAACAAASAPPRVAAESLQGGFSKKRVMTI
mmetsp:Transcript_8418/g.31428  ORF Transcript_8418/g.31428 Transcript_8418/m.31428 type:complete len:204 (-) Transcript_8418:809-1420(-)